MAKNVQISTEELIERCRFLYKKHGITVLSYNNLLKHGIPYWDLYQRGIGQQELVRLLGLEREYQHFKQSNFVRHRGDKIMRGWTWERVVKEVALVYKTMGFVPPAAWFAKNGNPAIIQGVYNLGKTWEDVRREFGSFVRSGFVKSRNGMRWRSHPEASFSNFLYARGVEHRRGGKYPDSFSKLSGLRYGYYDVSFLDKNKKWIDVEIWGDKPMGHNAERYAEKRKLKEAYNRERKDFIGIGYEDCYDEDRLTQLLRPYIGVIKPFIFQQAYDKTVPSTHWSNADELIAYCRVIASEQPDGIFPTEGWLRKRGNWENRKGDTYNTVSIYIKKWIGGIRKLREIMGQEKYSTASWNKEKVLKEYKGWVKTHGMTPGASRARFRRGQIKLSKDDFLWACCIEAAALKYFGGATEVRRALK